MVNDKIHCYDGWIYKCFFDPFLREIKDYIFQLVKPGTKVIDVACGTGTLAFELSKKCEFVTGVELSSKMVSHAQYAQRKKVIENVKFIHTNATTLDFEDNSFDYATISMALHEMSPDSRIKVLNEMKRIAKYVIIGDFAAPLPRGVFGMGVRFVEFMAGKEHFRGFKSFQRNGGISGAIELSDSNFFILKIETNQKGTVEFCSLS